MQAFGPEKDLMDLLRGVEQAISRTKSHRPLLHNITEGGVDLTVLVPMLLQQAEMVERAARAGLPPDNKGEGGAGPPDFKMFAQEENKYVLPIPSCVAFQNVELLASMIVGNTYNTEEISRTLESLLGCQDLQWHVAQVIYMMPLSSYWQVLSLTSHTLRICSYCFVLCVICLMFMPTTSRCLQTSSWLQYAA
jgi:hypothetical protein